MIHSDKARKFSPMSEEHAIIPFSNTYSYSQTTDAKYLPALYDCPKYSDYVDT